MAIKIIKMETFEAITDELYEAVAKDNAFKLEDIENALKYRNIKVKDDEELGKILLCLFLQGRLRPDTVAIGTVIDDSDKGEGEKKTSLIERAIVLRYVRAPSRK